MLSIYLANPLLLLQCNIKTTQKKRQEIIKFYQEAKNQQRKTQHRETNIEWMCSFEKASAVWQHVCIGLFFSSHETYCSIFISLFVCSRILLNLVDSELESCELISGFSCHSSCLKVLLLWNCSIDDDVDQEYCHCLAIHIVDSDHRTLIQEDSAFPRHIDYRIYSWKTIDLSVRLLFSSQRWYLQPACSTRYCFHLL